MRNAWSVVPSFVAVELLEQAVQIISAFEDDDKIISLDDPCLTTRLDDLLAEVSEMKVKLAWLREQVSTGALARNESEEE